MSYLLFLDESGHGHKVTPYEVRGGIAIHDTRLWPFVLALTEHEEECFGTPLRLFRKEIKGAKLLGKDPWKWAAQEPSLPGLERQRLARRFLEKGRQNPRVSPTRDEFTAYGQASLLLADRIFGVLREYEATLLAVAIPHQVPPPAGSCINEFLGKDIVFLLERYFYFLQERNEVGLLVMDETENGQDRDLVGRLERYFLRTQKGRERSKRIVPSPFFVSSEMAYPVQAADVCIYCVNWGFRLPGRGMDAAKRDEIASRFGASMSELQFKASLNTGNEAFDSYGIAYVSDPYEGRNAWP